MSCRLSVKRWYPMSDACPVLLRMMFAALALFVVTTIVSMPLSASAASYESCLGSCAIPSSANSPACTARRAACANPSGSAPSSNPQHYGAIAFSKKMHAYGVGSSPFSQRRADSIAMSECASLEGDCAVEVQFSNTCAALARTISAISGIFIVKSARNSSRTLAQANALSACERESGQRCKPVTSECSP